MKDIQKEQNFGSKKKRLYLISKEENPEVVSEPAESQWDIKPVNLKQKIKVKKK